MKQNQGLLNPEAEATRSQQVMPPALPLNRWVFDLFLPFLGYGLHCHRAIMTICRLIGIKDLYAKVSGSVNMLNLTRGLFLGLSRQVTLPWTLK